jgi:hypothetical protein
MKCSRAISVGLTFLVITLLAACSTPDVAKPGASTGSGKYYAVSAKETPFYHYGPLQGNGPDQKLPQDTLVTVVRPSFGYSKVRLLNGEQGYLASEDIHVASPALVAAATAPPSASSGISKFRLDSNDPRLIAPPPPLPADLPEPTPIPGTESSPAP